MAYLFEVYASECKEKVGGRRQPQTVEGSSSRLWQAVRSRASNVAGDRLYGHQRQVLVSPHRP